MSIADVRAIREGLATACKAFSGVTEAFPYIPRTIQAGQLPLVVVDNPDIEYQRGFGVGRCTLTFRLTCLVSEALHPDESTELLDNFVSEGLLGGGLIEELTSDQSLGGKAGTVKVDAAENYSLYKTESLSYYGVQLVVVVTT